MQGSFLQMGTDLCNPKRACPYLLNEAGYSPLHLAIKRGEIEAVNFAIGYKPTQAQNLCCHPFNLNQ